VKSSTNKWLLGAIVLLCLVPSTLAAKPKDKGCDPRRDRRCQQVPEGGSALVYVLGAGVAGLAAVVSRSRMAHNNA